MLSHTGWLAFPLAFPESKSFDQFPTVKLKSSMPARSIEIIAIRISGLDCLVLQQYLHASGRQRRQYARPKLIFCGYVHYFCVMSQEPFGNSGGFKHPHGIWKSARLCLSVQFFRIATAPGAMTKRSTWPRSWRTWNLDDGNFGGSGLRPPHTSPAGRRPGVAGGPRRPR